MTKLEEIGVPADLIIKLFETLNDSDKLTRDQLKELTSVMTKLVIANELKSCEEQHKELKVILVDKAKMADAELEKLNSLLQKDIIQMLTNLTNRVNLMIKTVAITFGLLTVAALIGSIVAKLIMD